MFSQFRQAVESLASADVRSQSPDPLRQSSSQLAENALVNLRKSIAAQRTTGPAQQSTGISTPRSASPAPNPNPKGPGDNGLRKTTLEERLRASFAASDSSPVVTPQRPSRSSSPASQTVPVTQHPLSPTAIPLPDSPRLSFDVPPSTLDTSPGASVPAGDQKGASGPLVHSEDGEDGIQLPNPMPPAENQDPILAPVDSTDSSHINSVPDNSAVREEISQEVAGPIPTAEPSEIVNESTIDIDPRGERSAETKPKPTISDGSQDTTVEALQERLKLVEQRFADVSTSFKQLQVERRDVDCVLSELTPLNGSKNVEALREYLINVNTKIEVGQDESQRLSGKLTRQDERLEELREIHRLEIASQSDQIEKLRQQLSEAEALIAASQSTASQTQEDNAKQDTEIDQLRAEASRANELAKEEEEKRVKAISLLKTVRQKLVKAEKDRDDALRELTEMRNKNSEEKEKERAERANLEKEIDAANAERERAVTGLRAQFDKDMIAAKDRAERDMQTARKHFDSEVLALQTSHSAELSAKKSRITTLEDTVVVLTSENKLFFEQLELRQAELESSQCHSESLQAQNTELQFQLKELQERINLFNDEVIELRGEHEIRSQIPGASAEEISQLVSSVESKYEAKLSELKRTLTTAEKERNEAEGNWSRKLTEKTLETNELKRMLQSSAQLREQDEDTTGALKTEIAKLYTEARFRNDQLHELQSHIDALKDADSTLHQRLAEATSRADDGAKQLEESNSREAQLCTQNKALRDELRKVQNSVTILERQRNPGVGYWSSASRSEVTTSSTSNSSLSDTPTSTSRPSVRNDEEINYEYLRNVIFQFLEHKEMRPNLVRVLSTILRFTPQETRRLMSKV